MLPPAEKLPAVGSADEARGLLAEDRKLALGMIAEAGERDLANRKTTAPWDPGGGMVLGRRLLDMVGHLNQHKGQLFYYLKLQGKPVHTGHLYGM
ncbi:MAG: DinB family protein, partial [Planctomycetota bacterium]